VGTSAGFDHFCREELGKRPEGLFALHYPPTLSALEGLASDINLRRAAAYGDSLIDAWRPGGPPISGMNRVLAPPQSGRRTGLDEMWSRLSAPMSEARKLAERLDYPFELEGSSMTDEELEAFRQQGLS
jgi:hypothetical protein